MNKIAKNLKDLYNFWQGIWAREIAAGLAFYFIVGFVPSLFLVVLALRDKFPNIAADSGFLGGFSNIAESFVQNAERAGKRGEAFLIITSLYSSVNLFYRFSRCGEILYKFEPKRGALAKRMIAFAFMVVTVSVFVAGMCAYFYIVKLMGSAAARVIAAASVCILAFVTVLIMNLLVCPYRLSVKEVLRGSMLTLVLWLVLTVGFSLYLDYFADYEKLYGIFGSLFALMLYVYLTMQSFTFGVAYNILMLGNIKRRMRKLRGKVDKASAKVYN